MDHPRVACRWESKLDGLDLSSCFSHVEGCLYARSSRANRAASAACTAAQAYGDVPRQLLLDAVPDIQIQQDHVRTNDDVRYEPFCRKHCSASEGVLSGSSVVANCLADSFVDLGD